MAIENNELAVIKKPGNVEYVTKEEYQERVKEIIRCKRDIIYFAETYYRVVHPAKGLHIIKLYDVQKEFLKFLTQNNKVICCSGRQQGKSTIYCIYALWLACFHQDKRIMMLAQAESTALALLDRIKTGYEYLPAFLKPGCEEWNKKNVRFTNRSTIQAFASSSNGPRGQSMNVLILDEFAFLSKSVEDKLFASVYPVVSQDPNGKIIIVSTPNGKDNLFYKIWAAANSKDQTKNKDGWKPFQMFYWQVPGHDTPEWKAAQIAAIGEQKFQQEYNCQFLDSDTVKKLIPDDIIEKYRKQYSDFKSKNINQGKELAIISEDGRKTFTFRMYQKFDPNRTYLCSSDIAEGIGKDSSVLYMWDITDTSNIKMVLKFSSNKISLIEFAYVTHKICQMYNNPFLACESNGLAIGYIEQLRVTYEYENFVRLNRDNGCGIQSHIQVKSKACLWTRDMLTTIGFGFEFHDLNLIDEMGTFIKKDTRVQNVYTAIGDNHDDHIMTLIWACWILNQENIEKYFVIGDTFTSSLGNVYPRTIGSLFDCTQDEYTKILEIPQVKEFMVYEELHKEEFQLLENENQKKQTNTMKFLHQNVLIGQNPQKDPNTKIYTQEGMIKQMNNGVSRQNDSGLIFGTGDSFGSNSQFGFIDDDFDGKMW